MKIFPIILSGGVGSRLWPASRKSNPKQLHALTSEYTLIQETARRVTGTLEDGAVFEAPMLVCNAAHQEQIAGQMRAIDTDAFAYILEPEGRNTAPAAALAALTVAESDPNGILILLAADHVIADTASFRAAIGKAAHLANDGFVVTYGVVPNQPETGYGYIKRGPAVGTQDGTYKVDAFREKPDVETAKTYLESGEFYWNSGIFTVRADKLIEEMKAFCPEILNSCADALFRARREDTVVWPCAETFAQCPSDSIDYAVMENTKDAAVVTVDMGWNDVGSWSALYDIGKKDEHGNVLVGDTLALESKNNLIRSDKRLIATYGVEDLVVVETEDAVLITKRDSSQGVKKIVDALKGAGRDEL